MKKKQIISLFTITFLIAFISLNSQPIYLGDYHIKHLEGSKKSEDPNTWRSITKENNTSYRNLSFDIRFADNCNYIMPPGHETEQTRKQKVVKLCTTESLESVNNLRIGWYYKPDSDKIVLAFYSHINHTDGKTKGNVGREYQEFEKEVNFWEWVHVDMAIGKKGMYMSIDGESIIISRSIDSWSSNGETTVAKAMSFFDWDDASEGALQNMDFYIKNAIMDDPNFPWKENSNSCYTANSVELMNTNFAFANQGPYEFYSGNSILSPIKPMSQSSITTYMPYEMPFCVIEPYINVTFLASESIVLDVGFYAKANSYFHAKIEDIQPPSPIIINSEPEEELTEILEFQSQNAEQVDFKLYAEQIFEVTVREGSAIFDESGFAQITINDYLILLPLNYYAVFFYQNDCVSKYSIKRLQKPWWNKSDSLQEDYDISYKTSFNNTINSQVSVLEKLNLFSEINIFPNPNTGNFNIQLNNNNFTTFEISVFNTMGETVYSEQNRTANKTLIDISSQPKGIYIVKIIIGAQTYIEKIVYQ